MSIVNRDVTRKVFKIRETKTIKEFCSMIGISKPTYYTRVRDDNWKVSEIYLIEKIKL